MSAYKVFRALIKLIKPKQTALLVFTCIAGYLTIGWALNPLIFAIAVTSIFLAVSAATVFNMYFDADIDYKMQRTRHRPLPSGEISYNQAAIFGFVLLMASIFIGVLISPLFLFITLLGFFIDVVVYTLWLKRKSPLSIVVGGIAGGMPVIAGRVAAVGYIDLLAILLAILVMSWIPTHIWNLVIFYDHDYRAADIPMLPILIGNEKTMLIILISNILTGVIIISLYLLGYFGMLYLLIVIVPTVIFVVGSLFSIAKKSKQKAWTMFKLSSPLLFLVFLAVILDSLLNLL
ncbi:MAG: heme o synthase [Candidatus Asgardarchaeia archaeon]